MTLVERDCQLSHLRRLLAGCMDGNGAAVIVRGPVGTGKTELLHTLATFATDAGVSWLGAVGSRAEQTLPLGVLSQLFPEQSIPAEYGSHRDKTLADTAESDPAHAFPPSAILDRTGVQPIRELWRSIVEVSTQKPVLICVDDVQHADFPSLRYLMYFARRVRSARVLVVLGETEVPHPVSRLLDDELLRQPHCRQITLSTLSPRGVAGMLGEQLDSAEAEQLAPGWHALTGGNPLLVRAMLEDRHNSQDELAIGNAFARAVLTCLHRGQTTTLRVARGLALTGRTTSRRVLVQVCGLDPISVERAIYDLTITGLVDQRGFRHPGAASVVLQDLSPGSRVYLHKRAAQVLHSEGLPAMAVARHLVAARHPDEPWACTILQEAADQALLKDEVETATDCLKLAYKACRDDDQRAVVAARLAEAVWRVSPSSAARHLPTLVRAVHDDLLRIPDALPVIKSLVWHGRLEEAAAALNRLNCSAADLSPTDIAELRIIQQWLWYWCPPLLAYLPDLSDLAPLGDPPAVAVSHQLRAVSALSTVLAEGPEEGATRAAEHFLRTSPLDDTTLDSLILALWALICSDDLHRAALHCDLLLKEAADRDASTWQAQLTAIRAEIAIRQGDLLAAENHARSALGQLPLAGWGLAVGSPLACLLRATTEMGRYDEAAAQLKLPVPDALLQTHAGLDYLHARGRYHLAVNSPHEALADFMACGELVTRWKLDLPALVPWRSDAATAQLRMGALAEARKLVHEQFARPGGEHARTYGITLRLLAAVSELRDRPSLLRKAVVLLESLDRLELARAMADLSNAHYALGEADMGRSLGNRAYHIAANCGAEGILRTLRPNQSAAERGTPAGARGDLERLGLLSDAERRVASLAALGYTNREIARTLYVTVSTVEQHLTNTYRKLGVQRRSDLPVTIGLDAEAV